MKIFDRNLNNQRTEIQKKTEFCAMIESGGHLHTQKTVAIAVGGVAAFGFLIVCLMFLKPVLKKRGVKC